VNKSLPEEAKGVKTKKKKKNNKKKKNKKKQPPTKTTVRRTVLVKCFGAGKSSWVSEKSTTHAEHDQLTTR